MDHHFELVHGLPRKELIEKLHFHRRQGEVAERALAFYLLEMEESRAYRPESGATSWARKHLDLERADKLLYLARRLEELPEIDSAFGRGELPWTKAREIARVAAHETEREWLHLAKRATSRELEVAVSGVKRGDRPGEGLKARRRKYVLKVPLTGEEDAVVHTALRKVRSAMPRGSTPAQALAEMSRWALQAYPEGRAKEGKTGGRGSFLVVSHLGKGGTCWIEAEDGRREVDFATLVGMIRSGARTVEVKDIAGAGVCGAIRFGEKGTVAPEGRDAPVSPDLKEAVLARDGRCLVCGSLESLTPHHLDSHAGGGESIAERLATLCLSCQAEVHQGDVVLRVEEDGGVTVLDREGREIGKRRSAEEVLSEAGNSTPLETIARAAPPAEATPPVDVERGQADEAYLTLDDLPADLTAAEWRALEARIAWSPAHRAFILGPPEDGGPVAAPADKDEKTAEKSAAPGVRPEGFDGFVGQERVVENLLLAARAARERGEPLGHVLLEGPPGLGKTTLARLIARESGSGLQETVAGNIADPSQLISLLVRLRKGGFLFIDEVHRLDAVCEEWFYPAMEDRLAHVVLREGGRTRALRIRLEAFTVVAATTRPGALSEPFRARFTLRERLEPYEPEELARVAVGAAGRLGVPLCEEAARELARRSKGTPREAIRMLLRARDLAQVSGNSAIDLAHVGQAAERLGVDGNGLDRVERAAVRVLLERARPLGVEALAARLGVDLESFRDVHEPWLERAGLIERTERGRVATEKARALYGARAEARIARRSLLDELVPDFWRES